MVGDWYFVVGLSEAIKRDWAFVKVVFGFSQNIL